MGIIKICQGNVQDSLQDHEIIPFGHHVLVTIILTFLLFHPAFETIA
ncbi:hypothetical protein [Sphingobacterium lactis]